MAVAVHSFGTVTPTVGTTATFTSFTSAGVYQLIIDTGSMKQQTSGTADETTVFIYTKVGTAGATSKLAYSASWWGAQSTPIKISIPVIGALEMDARILQSAGSAASYEWAIYELS